MAGHARRERRHAGERGRLDRRVAIAAVEAVVADVMLMAERHGLLDRRVPRRIFARVARYATAAPATAIAAASQARRSTSANLAEKTCAMIVGSAESRGRSNIRAAGGDLAACGAQETICRQNLFAPVQKRRVTPTPVPLHPLCRTPFPQWRRHSVIEAAGHAVVSIASDGTVVRSKRHSLTKVRRETYSAAIAARPRSRKQGGA